MDNKKLVSVNKLFEKDGMYFYSIPSDKFKTMRIDIFLVYPLAKKTSTKCAVSFRP